MVLSRTTGLRLVTGPLGFPGFASGTNMPDPMTCDNIALCLGYW